MSNWIAAEPRINFNAPSYETIDHVAFSPKGRMLAFNQFCHKVYVYEVANGEELCSITLGTGAQVTGLAFSPNGQLLAVGGSPTLWEIASGKRLWERYKQCDHLAFSPDGKFVACADGYAITFLDASTGEEVR